MCRDFFGSYLKGSVIKVAEWSLIWAGTLIVPESKKVRSSFIIIGSSRALTLVGSLTTLTGELSIITSLRPCTIGLGKSSFRSPRTITFVDISKAFSMFRLRPFRKFVSYVRGL